MDSSNADDVLEAVVATTLDPKRNDDDDESKDGKGEKRKGGKKQRRKRKKIEMVAPERAGSQPERVLFSAQRRGR